MKTKFARLRASFLLVLFSLGFVVVGQAWAQNASLDYEKAALVSKLAKYVTWPAEARQKEFIIGVYEDFEKYQYFRDYFANKGVKGKDISVRLIKTFAQAKNVHILYISTPNRRNLSSLADRIIRSANVLIITENSKDIAKTMIDISYDKEQSKINFRVVDPNIIDAKLKMPELSYFLDDNNAENEEILSKSPTFLIQAEHAERLAALKNQLSIQKSALTQLNNKLNVSEENLEKYNLALQQKSERLAIKEQESIEKSQEIKSKDQALKALEEQLQAQKTQLKMVEQDSSVVNDDLTDNDNLTEVQTQQAIEKIQAQEKAVADLTKQIEKQKELANNAVIKLSTVTKENKTLSSFQSLFYLFLLIAIIALIIAFIMWKKTKNAPIKASSQPVNENKTLLPVREAQLMKSENFAALGYIATDITYAVGVSLDAMQAQLEKAGDTKNAATLKPVVTLLNNFNLIAADQDDTESQRFDLIAYVQKMFMLYEFEFNQSDIVYSYTGEKNLTIKSVPSYIALVLLNIINNSLKHGFDNNGKGKIALKVEKGIKSGAKITYFDDGKGMSKAVLAKVFEPFFTTQSSRGYVGVGMSTSYDIIKNKLSGDIKIDSKEGKGTTVIITLP